MTETDFDKFVEMNASIEYAFEEDGGAILFRDTALPWYQKAQKNATRIETKKFQSMTAEAVLQEIRRGLEVEQITRITGYFTKVASWNSGKRGELKDRARVGGLFNK